MDPITLTAISLGATALGSGVGAVGSIMGGQAQSGMYKYQAGIAQMNQQIAEQDADYSRSVGEVEAQQSGMKTRFQIGNIKAGQSGSGLDVNSGSAALVRKSQHEVGMEDQAVIRSNAAKRAYGYEVEAAQQTAQGQVYKMAAEKSETAGTIGAITSILGGASSVSGKWLQAKQVGIFSG